METPPIVIKKSQTFITINKQMRLDLRQILQDSKNRSIEGDLPPGVDKQEELEKVFI